MFFTKGSLLNCNLVSILLFFNRKSCNSLNYAEVVIAITRDFTGKKRVGVAFGYALTSSPRLSRLHGDVASANTPNCRGQDIGVREASNKRSRPAWLVSQNKVNLKANH